VTVGAVIVALITLGLVAWQIRLAKKALKASTDALDLAKDELRVTRESNDLVREDLEFSRKQSTYLNRAARLVVSAHDRDNDVSHVTPRNSERKGSFYQTLLLTNDGDKTARDATILLWIPSEFDPVENYDYKHPDRVFGEYGFKYIANVGDESGKRYWHMAYDVPFPIYPGAPPRIVNRFTLWAAVPTTDFILWRITYDDGITPPQKLPPGRLGVTTIISHRPPASPTI
ncbi:MAG TPA: hypothetical protein VII69_12310, partial [Candidatus Eremiobacteraceae bacterium]